MKSVTTRVSAPLLVALLCVLCASGWPAAESRDDLSSQSQAVRPSALGLKVGDSSPTTARTITTRIEEAYGRLPLIFEANRGQTDSQVDFLARGSGYTLFLTPNEAVFLLSRGRERQAGSAPYALRPDHARPSAVLRMKLVSANEHAQGAATRELPGKINYFTGKEPPRWRTNIPTYARVAYQDVYPGIDVVYYGNQRQLEYDFVVRPGSSPSVIMLRYEGAERIELDPAGDLLVHSMGGVIRQGKPVIYQEVDGRRRPIPGGYVLRQALQVAFEIGSYDTSLPLVIDPTIVYSTFLGGGGLDVGGELGGIAVDAAGNAYVTGLTTSTNFPTTAGSFDTTADAGAGDVFVTKLDATGSTLLYSTYLSGSSFDQAFGLAVDSAGSAYVTGRTTSTNFPTTSGAFDQVHNGNFDAFITKLNASGSALVYSTYLGGGSFDEGFGVAVDAVGRAYITGRTGSSDFPTSVAAFDAVYDGNVDAFVTAFDATGSTLAYSTYLGGGSFDESLGVAVDSAGSAYVTGGTNSMTFPTTVGAFDTTKNIGLDAFVTRLDATGATLVYSTFLGGSNNDEGFGIGIDLTGSAYATGQTASTNFPTTVGAFDTTANGNDDVFVTRLNASGSTLMYSTYLGGSNADRGRGVAVDATGSAYVTGLTQSANFPTTVDAFDTTYGGDNDVFLTKLEPIAFAPLGYSTYLGDNGDDQGRGIAVDTAGNAYVTGTTSSEGFPTTPGAFDTSYNGTFDAFVVKVGEASVPATLVLSPPAATNPVETQHCVTATVRDANGNPVPDVTVRFTVTGAVNTSGSATTDANGEARFCYQGPPLPGADAITAFADTDNDNTQDPGEPSGAATKAWVLPPTTPLCEITITNGGRITAANGDKATFGGNAKADVEATTQGEEQYQDHGPVQPLNVHSITVDAIVCEGTMQASIFGQATVDGTGSFTYRIRVQDLGEPGRGQDTYWILLSNGYNSGEQVLEGGNVQIRRE